MPHVEWRGGTCRVKWWTGDVLPNGRKRYESQGGFTDEQEALNFGLDRESDIRNHRHISRSDGSILMKDWVATWSEALDLRHNSVRTYRSIIKNHILPYWGSKTVGEITPIAYRAWEKKIRPELTPNTVSSILSVFGMIMADAVENRLRPASPVPARTRRGKYARKPREKKRHMQMDTIHRLAVNAQKVWGYAGFVFVYTAPFTGMRIGELYGLRREFTSPAWPVSDPDRERREESVERYASMPALRVQWQHQYEDGVPKLVAPKYESYRTLVLPPFLAEMHEKLLASHDSEWVFPSIQGGPLISVNFYGTYWHPIRDGAEARTGQWARPAVPRVEAFAGKRPHLLRHAHKEWLDEDGHPKVAVEARMGHELAGVEGVYANVTPGMELRIAETLQERYERFVREAGLK